jgi:hypothetical protein
MQAQSKPDRSPLWIIAILAIGFLALWYYTRSAYSIHPGTQRLTPQERARMIQQATWKAQTRHGLAIAEALAWECVGVYEKLTSPEFETFTSDVQNTFRGAWEREGCYDILDY